MIIQRGHHRARIVKGWAFRNHSYEVNKAILKFLETGNTDDLPEEYKRKDYSIYLTRT